METKQCRTCGLTKPADDFSADKSRKDGLNNRCRVCDRLKSRARYAIWRDAILARQRAQKRQHRNTHREEVLARQRAQKAAQRARKRSERAT